MLWCTEFRNDKDKLIGVLIANKTDLDDRRRRVSPKVGHELANQLGLVYFECSAKDFQGTTFYAAAKTFSVITIISDY